MSFMALNPGIVIDQEVYASNVESMVAYIKSGRWTRRSRFCFQEYRVQGAGHAIGAWD